MGVYNRINNKPVDRKIKRIFQLAIQIKIHKCNAKSAHDLHAVLPRKEINKQI